MEMYLAVQAYTTAYGAPVIDGIEVFKTYHEARDFIREEIRRAYKSVEGSVINDEELEAAVSVHVDEIDDGNSSRQNWGDGVQYLWAVVTREL